MSRYILAAACILDLSYHDRLAHPSTSLALGYRAKVREVSSVDGPPSLPKWRTPAEVRGIHSGIRADQEQQNEQQ